MRLPITIYLIISALLPFGAAAQQNVGQTNQSVESPTVNPGNTVTFRLESPKAKSVKVIGDWSEDASGKAMTKDRNGVWSFTTDTLPSELYTYRYVVDGMTIIDPANPFTKRDVGSVFSMFYIGDGPADYYQVRDVPHGTLRQEMVSLKCPRS